jgi:hypothetical protein
MLEPGGKPNPALAAALASAPKDGDPGVPMSEKCEPHSLLPPENQRGYVHYEGSLTTPPCSEGVQWYVMKNVVNVEDSQVGGVCMVFAWRCMVSHGVAWCCMVLHGEALVERLRVHRDLWLHGAPATCGTRARHASHRTTTRPLTPLTARLAPPRGGGNGELSGTSGGIHQ